MARTPINRVIKEAKDVVVREAVAARDRGDYVAKVAWELRSDYLRRIASEFAVLSQDTLPSTVFVSYSKNSGATYFAYVERILRDNGFEVITGFQRHENDNENVLKRVRSQLERSTLYLAILTQELQITVSGEQRWLPSVWTVEEKGMALALQKPFVLMVEDGVHDHYWKKTTPDTVHQMFNKNNFAEVAATACQALRARYDELILKGRITA